MKKEWRLDFSCSCLSWIWDRKCRACFSRKKDKLLVWVLPWASMWSTNKRQEKRFPRLERSAKRVSFELFMFMFTKVMWWREKCTLPIRGDIAVAIVQANKERQRNGEKMNFLFTHDHACRENVGKWRHCRHSVSKIQTNCNLKHRVSRRHTKIKHARNQKQKFPIMHPPLYSWAVEITGYCQW